MKRLFIKLKDSPKVELSLYLGLFLLAAALRFWDLGARAYHHDESLHAYYSWKVFAGQGYEHMPMMHGPFQFHFNALVFHLFGDSDYTARVLPAFFGSLAVLLPYLLRRQMGRGGSLLACLFLTISPSVLYFSRFARNDIYILFWDLILVICLWRYLEERKARYLYLSAASLSLSFATKEVTYINIAIFLIFLLIVSAKDLAGRAREKLALSRLAAPGALFILWGTLTLPQLAAAVGLFQSKLGVVLVNADEAAGPVGAPLGAGYVVAGIVVSSLLLASGLVGWRWKGRQWLIAAFIFYVIYFLLYTSFLSRMGGFASGIWASLGYWLVQHGVERGAQPWFYYLVLLPLYEFLPLIFALGGAVYHSWKGNLFSRFLIFWALASLILYSVAGEKMPWLILHIALPVILLGAKFAAELLEGKIFRGRAIRILTALLLCFLLVVSLRTAWLASYGQDEAQPEMLVYAQISSDVLPIKHRIEKLAEESGLGKELPITVDTQVSWPWTWYLRDYKAVEFRDLSQPLTAPPAGVVLLVGAGNERNIESFQEGYAKGFSFRQLIWFPERYRELQPHSFVERDSWQSWWRYFINREISQPYWSTRGIAYFPKQEP